jgi:cytochrome P450
MKTDVLGIDVLHAVDRIGPTFRRRAKRRGCSIGHVPRAMTITPRPPVNPVEAVTHPDPWPYYAHLRAGGVWLDQATRTWVVPDAVTIARVLGDPRLRVRPPLEPVPTHIVGTAAGDVFCRLARTNDGERHDELRSHVDELVESIDPERARASARAIAERYGADVSTDVDLDGFLDAVPVLTIATELGIHCADARLLGAVRDLASAFRPAAEPTGTAAASRAVDLLLAVVDRRVAEAGDDEQRANVVGLLFQTLDATAGLLGATLVRLASDRHTRRAVEIGTLDRVVEDVLRAEPPVHNTRRYAEQATMIAGHRVERGDTVLLVLAAAASEHLAFGSGSHRCPADRLAAAVCCGAVDGLVDSRPDLLGRCVPLGFRPSASTRIPVFSALRPHRGVRPTRRS